MRQGSRFHVCLLTPARARSSSLSNHCEISARVVPVPEDARLTPHSLSAGMSLLGDHAAGRSPPRRPARPRERVAMRGSRSCGRRTGSTARPRRRPRRSAPRRSRRPSGTGRVDHLEPGIATAERATMRAPRRGRRARAWPRSPDTAAASRRLSRPGSRPPPPRRSPPQIATSAARRRAGAARTPPSSPARGRGRAGGMPEGDRATVDVEALANRGDAAFRHRRRASAVATSGTAANASLISIRSTSSIEWPLR